MIAAQGGDPAAPLPVASHVENRACADRSGVLPRLRRAGGRDRGLAAGGGPGAQGGRGAGGGGVLLLVDPGDAGRGRAAAAGAAHRHPGRRAGRPRRAGRRRDGRAPTRPRATRWCTTPSADARRRGGTSGGALVRFAAVSDVVSDVSESAQDVVESKPVRLLGRVGLLAYGGVHLVLAAVIVQVPFGEMERADKKGALEEIAETVPGPRTAVVRHARAGRAGAVAARRGDLGPPRGPRRHARVAGRDQPGGSRAVRRPRLVGGVDRREGRVVEAVEVLHRGRDRPARRAGPDRARRDSGLVVGACYAVYRGVTSAFLRELDLSGASPEQTRWAIRLGRIGWAALGLVYGFPGVLFIVAATTYSPGTPTSLGLRAPHGRGRALRAAADHRARARPRGVRVYCFFDARYRKA